MNDRARDFLNEQRGERTLFKPFATEALRTFARSRLAAYKVPKHVTIVDDYPRTAAGKVQKHLLRQTLRSVE